MEDRIDHLQVSNSRPSASAEVSFSGLALLTVGNGGKGTRPWRFAGTGVSVKPGKFGLLESSVLPGIAAERYAEVALLTHRQSSGMRVRERTRGGATRDTNVVNREG